MSCSNVPAILLPLHNPGRGRTLETRVQLSKHQESRTEHGNNSSLKAVLYLLKAQCFRNKFFKNCCLLYDYNPGSNALQELFFCFCFSRVQLSATPWTVACQALLSMRFSRQEYCGRLPFPSQEDPGIKSESLASPALAGGLFHHRASSCKAVITRQHYSSLPATPAMPCPYTLGGR